MGDDNGRPDERPAHRVTLSAFRLAVLPVTNEDYAAFLAATGHEPPRFWDDPAFNRPRQPVVGVSWFDAVAYCEWLSACPSGQSSGCPPRPSGRKPRSAAWTARSTPGATSHSTAGRAFKQDATWEVGAAPPNGYGLIDIGFNVHEWCSDWYDPAYYAVSPEHDPPGPATGVRRASRGGAWRHAVKVSRCSARSSIPPDYRYNDYGFRLALSVEEST